MVGVPEVGVAIQGHLAVQRQDLVVGGAHQRVDLDQRRVLADKHLPQLRDGHRRRIEHLGGKMALLGDRTGEGHVDTLNGVHRDLGQPIRLGGGHLLDLHPALHRAHGEVGAVGPVEQEGDVVLLGDVAGLGHQQFLHDVALDVQAQDVRGVGEGVVRGGRVFDTPRFAATSRLDLSFHHDRSADLLGDRLGVLRGGRYPAGCGGNVMLGEQFLRLILEKVHGLSAGLSAESVDSACVGRLSASIV